MSDCSVYNTPYGYNPTLTAGIIFTTIYGLLTLFTVWFTVRRKLWFLAFALGAFMETLGWGARAAAHDNYCNSQYFIMQITCLIMAPAFFSAALYILLGVLIQKKPQNSVLSARNYLIIFCGVDLLSLALQGAGGGMASSASDDAMLTTGTNIIIAGVFVQLVGMLAFVALALVFFIRSATHGITFDARVLTIGLISTILIFIRNIYRAVELIDGWSGSINTNENFLIGLDGVTMVLCLLSLCYLVIVDLQEPEILRRNKSNAVLAEKDVESGMSTPSTTSVAV